MVLTRAIVNRTMVLFGRRPFFSAVLLRTIRKTLGAHHAGDTTKDQTRGHAGSSAKYRHNIQACHFVHH